MDATAYTHTSTDSPVKATACALAYTMATQILADHNRSALASRGAG